MVGSCLRWFAGVPEGIGRKRGKKEKKGLGNGAGDLHRRDSENAEIPELSAYGAERIEPERSGDSRRQTDDLREPGG